MDGVVHSTDGVLIHYEAHGAGEPALVLVHGWSCDRSYWRGQVDHFAGGRQVVSVDLAGHGESGRDRDSWTMSAFGNDVASVVRELGLERVVLVGHSMGGDVIVEAALRLSDRVLGLVWVDVYSRLGEPRTRAECEAFAAPFREDFTRRTLDFVRQMFPAGADPRLVDPVSADMAAAPRDVAIPALEQAIANHGPMLERLPLLAAELVAINPASGKTDVEGLRRHGIRTVPVPGVGHFPMLEDEAGFNRILSEVLDGLGV